jgi:hypothetical protein
MSRFHVADSLSFKSTSAKVFATFIGYCLWITGYHFQTCEQVFDEITTSIAKSSFTMAFATFVNYRPWIAGSGLDERNVNPKDVVAILNDGFSAQSLRCFAFQDGEPNGRPVGERRRQEITTTTAPPTWVGGLDHEIYTARPGDSLLQQESSPR